jgi:RHS repeat-associated protein
MPKQIIHSSGVTTDILYDGMGTRVKKSVGTTHTYYIGDHFEIEGGTFIKYIFAGNLRVAQVKGSTQTYFHKDHLGSSTVMTNASGAEVESTDYMPFGGIRNHTGTNTSNYKFTDQELDAENGLYNYNARLYDPVIGRFITPDTIIPEPYNPQSLNRYAYARNNPLIYTDPTGHAPNTWYLTKHIAAHDFAVNYNDDSIRNNAEYSPSFYKMKNEKGVYGWAYTIPNRYCKGTGLSRASEPKSGVSYGTAHTHDDYDRPSDNEFSQQDRDLQDGEPYDPLYYKEDMYVVTPEGGMIYRDPETGAETGFEYDDIPSDPSLPEEQRKSKINPYGPDQKADPYIETCPEDEWEYDELYPDPNDRFYNY